MAKMISRKGYWGTACSNRCGYCDNWPRHNKTSVRRQEHKQWLEEADIDGFDWPFFWEWSEQDGSFLEWEIYNSYA